jgi:myosin heavy subunit
MILQFTDDKKYTFCGATMETYLLEKSRITYQMEQERNYHVFYLIIKGATEVHTEMKDKLQIADVTEYLYTNGSGCYTIPGVDDKAEYKDFHHAMYFVGMDDAQIFSTFQVISCVLALGNCNFKDNDKDEAEAVDSSWVAIAANQLGVPEPALFKCLTEEMREVKVPLIV